MQSDANHRQAQPDIDDVRRQLELLADALTPSKGVRIYEGDELIYDSTDPSTYTECHTREDIDRALRTGTHDQHAGAQRLASASFLHPPRATRPPTPPGAGAPTVSTSSRQRAPFSGRRGPGCARIPVCHRAVEPSGRPATLKAPDDS